MLCWRNAASLKCWSRFRIMNGMRWRERRRRKRSMWRKRLLTEPNLPLPLQPHCPSLVSHRSLAPTSAAVTATARSKWAHLYYHHHQRYYPRGHLECKFPLHSLNRLMYLQHHLRALLSNSMQMHPSGHQQSRLEEEPIECKVRWERVQWVEERIYELSRNFGLKIIYFLTHSRWLNNSLSPPLFSFSF